jgi:hypothetical protein
VFYKKLRSEYITEVLNKSPGPEKIPAKNIMPPKVLTIGSSSALEESSKLMIEKKAAKSPVVSGKAKWHCRYRYCPHGARGNGLFVRADYLLASCD